MTVTSGTAPDDRVRGQGSAGQGHKFPRQSAN
jgi:hypothetical protein